MSKIPGYNPSAATSSAACSPVRPVIFFSSAGNGFKENYSEPHLNLKKVLLFPFYPACQEKEEARSVETPGFFALPR
jgi:hypothetical protein